MSQIVDEISRKDILHARRTKGNISYLQENYAKQYEELVGLVDRYFQTMNFQPVSVAGDYLKMISDMRKEGLYFYKHGKYRCESQSIANEYVYSRPEIMSYYMNALLISQILWKHHFKIFVFFQEQLRSLFNADSKIRILDVGPGHGFFSYLIKKEFPGYEKLDLVDISDTSLAMTKKIIGFDYDKIQYYRRDIFDYDETSKYDFIVLGEVIEHLDNPKEILVKLSKLLSPGGYLWITTPTNSPALDHVYLFKSKDDVFELVEDSGLKIALSCNYFAEDGDEELAQQRRVTNLVGLFCKSV